MARFLRLREAMHHTKSGNFRSLLFRTAAAGSEDSIDFNDGAKLFARRTDAEIARAVLVLQLCSVDSLVDRSLQASYYSYV